MKAHEITQRVDTTAYKVAKSIVLAVLKQNYVEEDVEKAVNLAIAKFAENLRSAAREELQFQRIPKISPKSQF